MQILSVRLVFSLDVIYMAFKKMEVLGCTYQNFRYDFIVPVRKNPTNGVLQTLTAWDQLLVNILQATSNLFSQVMRHF